MSCQAAERETLTFLAAGTLEPAERAAALTHLEGCAECRAEWPALRQLVSGLRELHLTPEEVLDAVESRRDPDHLALCGACRDEVARFRAVEASLRPKTGRIPAWAAAVAAGLTLALAGWLALRGSQVDPAPPGGNLRGGAPAAGPGLEKLPVKLTRGSQVFVDDLSRALVPYRTDDYEEAVRRLGEVAARHPQAAEPLLYQGAALLLQGRAREAVAPLERALALAPEGELYDDAFFHLGLARLRAGDGAGRETLTTLCAAEGAYRAKACRALGER